MGTELELHRGLTAMLDSLGDLERIDFEIVADNRAKYAGMLFDFDKVVGYAKDLRLIEYTIEDIYERNLARSRKIVHIFRYGTHPTGDPGVIRREHGDPSGHWDRFFKDYQFGKSKHLLSDGARSDRGRENHAGGSGNDLPSGESQAKLLEPPRLRSGRDPER